jgi:hypothetical protein
MSPCLNSRFLIILNLDKAKPVPKVFDFIYAVLLGLLLLECFVLKQFGFWAGANIQKIKFVFLL